MSSLMKSIDKGGVYADEDGTPGDALDILRRHGLNAIRLRVWVNPPDGYHDKAELLKMARRAKSQGLNSLQDYQPHGGARIHREAGAMWLDAYSAVSADPERASQRFPQAISPA